MAYVQKVGVPFKCCGKIITTNLRPPVLHLSAATSRTISNQSIFISKLNERKQHLSRQFQTDKSCLSPQSLDEDLTDKAKVRKFLNVSKSKKIPMSVKSLLERRTKDSTFPKIERLSKLSREFSFAGVDVDGIETILMKQIMTSTSKKDDHHESKEFLDEFIASPARSCTRKSSLKSFIATFEELHKSEIENISKQGSSSNNHNVQVKANKRGSSLNRIRYFVMILRMGFVFENAVRIFDQGELRFIEKFCKSVSEKFDDPAPLFIFWMSVFQKGSDLTTTLASRLARERPEIMNCLMNELREYSHDYSKEIEDTPSHLLFQNLPRIFCVGDFTTFCDRLDTLDDVDRTFVYRSLCFKSLALWNAGKFSKGLTSLAVAAEYWLANLSVENSPHFLPLGVDVVLSWSTIVESAVKNGFEPAVKFFDVVCNKLAVVHPVPIIPYVCLIHYKTSERFSSKCDDVLKLFPSIDVLKNDKFERALTIASMTIETKNYFVGEVVKTVPNIDKELRTVEESTDSHDDTIVFSPKVIQDMLDVRILELLKEEESLLAVQFVLHEANKNIFPSEEVLILIAQNLAKSKDVQNLALLRSSLPVQTSAGDKIYEYELTQRLAEIHQLWIDGHQSKAVELILRQYRLTLEEEFRVRFESFDFLLTKVRRYIRLYLEELLAEDDSSKELWLVEKEGKDFSEIYRDFSILGLYWETHFFSPNFKHQAKASDFINENPKLPRNLNIDHLLGRAFRYSDEKLFRSLVEICLQFDLDNYEKTRSLEGLLIHQCDHGNVSAAKSTLDYALECGITLGPEATQAYLMLSADMKASRNRGFFSAFSNMFSSKENK